MSPDTAAAPHTSLSLLFEPKRGSSLLTFDTYTTSSVVLLVMPSEGSCSKLLRTLSRLGSRVFST